MSEKPRISYVVAVHNSTDVLESTVATLTGHLSLFPGSEIVLVENGSSDSSPELCRTLAERAGSAVKVIATESPKGLGCAFRRGLEVATGDVVVLAASDLPFGTGDLDAALALVPRPDLVLGSKGHPDSKVRVTAKRRVLSWGFRLARRMTLGLDQRDTQGSHIIDGALVRRIRPHLRADDYLVQTEIVAWAVHYGARPVEVPVVYEAPLTSTVSPVRDAWRMGIGLLQLRERLRQAATAELEGDAASGTPRAPGRLVILSAGAILGGLAAVVAFVLAVGGIDLALTRIGFFADHPPVSAAVAWGLATTGLLAALLRVRRLGA